MPSCIEVRALVHRLARRGRGPRVGHGAPRPGRRAGRPVRRGDHPVRPARDGLPAAGGVEHRAVATAADVAVTPAESVGLKTAFSDALGHRRPARERSTTRPPSATSRATSTTPTAAAGPSPPAARDHSLTVGFTRTVTRMPASTSATRTAPSACRPATGIDVTGTLSGLVHLRLRRRRRAGRPHQALDDHRDLADLPAGTQLNAGLGILGVKVIGAAGTDRLPLESNVTTSLGQPRQRRRRLPRLRQPRHRHRRRRRAGRRRRGHRHRHRHPDRHARGPLVAEPRANDRVADLPRSAPPSTSARPSPATFDAPAVTVGGPRGGRPFLTLTPRDLAAGALAGRLGDPRHAGRRGRQPPADARLDRQRRRRGRRHQGLPRRPGARRRPGRPHPRPAEVRLAAGHAHRPRRGRVRGLRLDHRRPRRPRATTPPRSTRRRRRSTSRSAPPGAGSSTSS